MLTTAAQRIWWWVCCCVKAGWWTGKFLVTLMLCGNVRETRLCNVSLLHLFPLPPRLYPQSAQLVSIKHCRAANGFWSFAQASEALENAPNVDIGVTIGPTWAVGDDYQPLIQAARLPHACLLDAKLQLTVIATVTFQCCVNNTATLNCFYMYTNTGRSLHVLWYQALEIIRVALEIVYGMCVCVV